MTTSSLPTVTDKEVALYHENGYLIVEDCIDQPTMEALRQETDRIVAEAGGLSESDAVFDLEDSHTAERPRVRRIKSPHDHFEFFQDLVRHPGLMAVATRLLGPNVRLHNTKMNIKDAEFGAPVEWHQDWAFYPHTNDDVLAAGILLDDCDLENGPLLVVPGSQKGPIADHHADGYFCGAVAPENFNFDPAEAFPMTAKAGTVTFHHVRTMHGSDLNRSDRARRLMLFGYAAADAWPLIPFLEYDDYEAMMVAGESTLAPRVEPVPVRLPLPPAPLQGSIYENQKGLGNRFFDTYDED